MTETYNRVTYSERYATWIPDQWIIFISIHPADGFTLTYTDRAGRTDRRRFIGCDVREAVAVLAGQR